MEKILTQIKLAGNKESKWDMKYLQILPAPTESATENIGEGLHYYEIYSR